jgi:HEAT repeat protein
MLIRSLLGMAAMCLVFCSPGLSKVAEPDTSEEEQVLKSANVGTDPAALMQYLKKLTLNEGAEEKIKKLIVQLGDDDFDTREAASRDLKSRGPVALPFLRAAKKNTDPEVVRRAEDCVDAIEHDFAPAVVTAVVRVLAARKPTGTAEVLLEFLPSTDNPALADELRVALEKVAVRDGKAESAVVAALADKSAARRAAAGVALARAGLKEHRQAVRKLLEDADPAVRLRVGLVLASAREKAALPVLIDLIDKVPLRQLAPLEDLLYRLADEKQPPVLTGIDEAARRKYREAWARWWTENGDRIDLAREESPHTLGYTLIVLLDDNKVLEVDANGKTRWEITGIQFPLDVQYLPGDRILVAEQSIGRVSERTLDGKSIWERKFNEPFMAQRLPNGNTFIAGRQQMIEIDCKDDEVFSYSVPNGDQLMRAQRLNNGEIACVIQRLNTGTEFVHLDITGKQLHHFPVNVGTSGGRVQMLPNGHVLVPEMYMNRVVEYDMEGKVAWELAVNQPIVATRLPNGNTLVTSMLQRRAIEFDRDRKEVWEFKHDTRVTRAFRR